MDATAVLSAKERERLRKQAYYLANRDRIRARNKRWYEKNREQVNAKHLKYYYDNIQKEKQRRRLYQHKNREAHNARGRAHYWKNRDAISAKRKVVRQANPEVGRQRSKTYRLLHPEKARASSRKCLARHILQRAAYNVAVMHHHKDRLHQARMKHGGKCTLCSIDDLRTLQFDHIDRRTKKLNISACQKKSDKVFWNEVAKCRLLCANCHHLETNYSVTYVYPPSVRAHKARLSEAKSKLGGKCQRCQNSDYRVLQFDHLPLTNKIEGVASMYSASKDEFWAEVAKCRLLCANCHQINTHYEVI